jgi:hypothetical protein
MFRVKTQANASVYLDLNGERIHTKTLDDGYFKFSIPLQKEFGYGWMEYRVSLIHNGEEIFSKGSFIRPLKARWVSFLISTIRFWCRIRATRLRNCIFCCFGI